MSLTKNASILLAEFEFENHDFELIEEAKNEVYVKIERICRTTPFVGMKQPTPIGGILGYEAILTIKHLGELVSYPWTISQSGDTIAEGLTDMQGKSENLPIPMNYGRLQTYTVAVFEPEPIEESESENNALRPETVAKLSNGLIPPSKNQIRESVRKN
ncbi:MAG: hypothetical protein ACTSPB_16190 [Candidatus Thorarchaeota archaeon]